MQQTTLLKYVFFFLFLADDVTVSSGRIVQSTVQKQQFQSGCNQRPWVKHKGYALTGMFSK